MSRTPQETYIEFFYCLYKGKLTQSRFIGLPKHIEKDYLQEAISEYKRNPLFNKLYKVNLDFMKQNIDFMECNTKTTHIQNTFHKDPNINKFTNQ